MAKCPKCGKDSNSKFCTNCGYKFEKNEDVVIKKDAKNKDDLKKKDKNQKLKVKETEESKNKKLITGVVAVSLILIVILCVKGCAGNNNVAEEPKQWPTEGLLSMLPEPEGFISSVDDIEENEESADIKYIDKTMYDNYVDLCKEEGFDLTDDVGNPTIDDDEVYISFNKDGYRLELGFRENWSSDDDNEENTKVDGMEVVIHETIGDDEITWPTAGIGSTIPIPDSLNGNVSYESDTTFDVYINNTDLSSYNEYVSKLMGTKYSVDYDKYKYYYYARNTKNEEKYATVEAEYWGNSIMHLSVSDYDFSDLYDDEEEDEDDDSYSDDYSNDSSSSFRDTMDEYEDFIDDYVSFMKKYKKSKDTSGMLGDYTDMLEEYSDWINEIEDIDTDSLSSDDYEYYVEVTTRCLKKISDAGI